MTKLPHEYIDKICIITHETAAAENSATADYHFVRMVHENMGCTSG
jgi:hypothetical protein